MTIACCVFAGALVTYSIAAIRYSAFSLDPLLVVPSALFGGFFGLIGSPLVMFLLRREPTATSPLSIVAFSVAVAMYSGIVFALIRFPANAAEFFFILFAAFVGGLIGLLGSPILILLFRRRLFRGAGLPIVAITTFATLCLSVVIPFSGGAFVVYLSIGAFIAISIAMRKRAPKTRSLAGLCYCCSYDLRGSAGSQRCPECGTPFDTNLALPERPLVEIPKQPNATTAALILLALLPLMFGIGRTAVVYNNTRPLAFDSARWLAGSDSVRLRMTRDLVTSGEFSGLTEAEVIKKLGQPASISSMSSRRITGSTDTILIYDLPNLRPGIDMPAFQIKPPRGVCVVLINDRVSEVVFSH